jgi:peptidyl-prolyl cis-trans isomerase SurA
MKSYKTPFISSFFLSLALSCSFAFAENAPAKSSKKLVDKIIAIVNQNIILKSEYDGYKTLMASDLKKAGRISETENIPVFEKRVLDQMIEDQILDQEIKRLGLEANDTQVESVIGEVMKNNGIQTRKEFVKALQAEGIEYEEYTADFKKRIGRSNLVNQMIRPKIKISDDEIDAEYQKRSKSNTKQIQYKVGMIFIAETHTSQSEMEKIRSSIKSLQDFSNVASRKSEGPGKDKGGEMGWTDPVDLQGPLSDALKSMKKGDISSVIHTESGYYILANLDQKTIASKETQQVKNTIQEDLTNTMITKNLNQYIFDLKQKAHIETFL